MSPDHEPFTGIIEAITAQMRAQMVTPAELARRAGVSIGCVHRLLRGDESATLADLVKVCQALSINFEVNA